MTSVGVWDKIFIYRESSSPEEVVCKISTKNSEPLKSYELLNLIWCAYVRALKCPKTFFWAVYIIGDRIHNLRRG